MEIFMVSGIRRLGVNACGFRFQVSEVQGLEGIGLPQI
jgi:hypothetical protein